MLQSKLLTKVSKTFPEGEESKNAKWLIRGGFINKSSSGVYSILPLGLRVLKNIIEIVREEMNAIDGQELSMPALVEKKYWEKTNRWNLDVAYKTGKSKNDEDYEFGLGWSHEEIISHIASIFLNSYKDLPKSAYQFQTKFRKEARAQGGLLRGREFLMKDMYSFHLTQEDLDKYYLKAWKAYEKAYKRMGLKTIAVEAGGGDFTNQYTHELQVLNDVGEDLIYYCNKCGFAQNKEVYKPENHKNCSGEILNSKGVEVGNIFKLGTKYSDAFQIKVKKESGEESVVIMGCYGIGITRALGMIVEEHSDERGIIWPKTVAPFKAHFINLRKNKDKEFKKFIALYEKLTKNCDEILFDDRADKSAGEKFAESDILGIPLRVVCGEKTGTKLEIKERNSSKFKLVSYKEIEKYLAA